MCIRGKLISVSGSHSKGMACPKPYRGTGSTLGQAGAGPAGLRQPCPRQSPAGLLHATTQIQSTRSALSTAAPLRTRLSCPTRHSTARPVCVLRVVTPPTPRQAVSSGQTGASSCGMDKGRTYPTPQQRGCGLSSSSSPDEFGCFVIPSEL